MAVPKAFVLQQQQMEGMQQQMEGMQQQIQDLRENLQLLVDKAKVEAQAKARADAERKADEIIGKLRCMSLKIFSIN